MLYNVPFSYIHGHRKDFFQGGNQGIYPKIFKGGPKVVKYVFSQSKLRIQVLLLKFSNSRGVLDSLCPSLPMPMVTSQTFFWKNTTHTNQGEPNIRDSHESGASVSNVAAKGVASHNF